MDDIYSSKPWLKSYDKHVPPTITEYPQKSCAEAMREAFDGVPDRMALNYMGTNISFREFDTYSNQFAHFLIQPGDAGRAMLLGSTYSTSPRLFSRPSASRKQAVSSQVLAYCLPPKNWNTS